MLWFQWVTFVSGSFATLLNAGLLPIILWSSSEKIGTYKYMLLFYTLTATCMTACQVNTLAAWWAPRNGYVFFSTVDVYPLWLQNIFLYGYCAGFNANLVIICWCYFVRLSILQGANILESSIGRKVWIAAVISCFYFVFLMFDIYLINRTPETIQLFGQEIWNISEVNLEDVAFIAGQVIINHFPNIRLFFSVGIFVLHMSGVTIFVIICWVKIRGRLMEMRKMQASGTSFRVQYRLYILLTFQALLPLTFNTIPAGLAFLAGLTQVELGILVTLSGAILSFAQIIDPILTVFFVSEYRRLILKILGLKKARIYGESTTSAAPQSSTN